MLEIVAEIVAATVAEYFHAPLCRLPALKNNCEYLWRELCCYLDETNSLQQYI